MPTQESPTIWQSRRLALIAAALLFTTYLVVFIDAGAQPSLGVWADAAGNVVAAVIAAWPVVLLCRALPWRLADRIWFVPAHICGVLAFLALWALTTAASLALRTGLRSGDWTLVWFTGPARSWQGMTALVMYFAIAGGCYAAQAARDASEAAALQLAAELRALRAQLDPHLLFNTLHSLLELVRSGDERADEAIERFARVARYVAEGRTAGSTVSLRDEWRMLEDYLALEALRLGPRLTLQHTLLGDATEVRLPALTLQPLAENAIRHGIAPRAGPGTLEVRVHVTDGAIDITVDDDGLGAAAPSSGQGTGLAIVHKRLQTMYGDALAFTAGPRREGGWRVHARFPRHA
ncbi:MAG: histidine kinase [Gemmatimonadaceae bacterium]|jgi:signal transduction histidine kinase|nr:histidine kinase [Gemmatimonadaceae bacterium]